MNKKVCLAVMLALVIVFGGIGTVKAEVIPPTGPGQIGYDAVVLCESLTVRQEPDVSSKAVMKLPYGKRFMVLKQEDGWAQCIFSDDVDASPAGWVKAEYLVIDPAWYRTEEEIPVYAWNDESAPKVALLNADTKLPILKEEGEWIIVSLRGATGWIHK